MEHSRAREEDGELSEEVNSSPSKDLAQIPGKFRVLRVALLGKVGELSGLSRDKETKEGGDEAEQSEVSEHCNVVASRTHKVLADDGTHSVAESGNDSEDVTPQGAEVEAMRGEEVRVESEEDASDAEENGEVVCPEVAHLEPDNGEEGGGEDTENADHGHTGNGSELVGPDEGVESDQVEERTHKVDPLGVGSVAS